MTEHFSFFDAIQDSNGHYDREYNAQQFTDYFKSLVTTGVMKGAYNQLEVTANGANMVSAVKSGVAFVEGRYYYNDALLQLTHDTEVIGLSRIDRIVVRMDLSTDGRYVKTFIKKGVPAASPVPPTLTQTTTVYEISLAQVKIVGGQTYIAANAVTDERGKDVICPWAGSKILPNFDNVALEGLISSVTTLENDINTKLSTVVYVDGNLGANTPINGTASGVNAYKTIYYALSRIKKLNLGTVRIIVASGIYNEIVTISNFIARKISLEGTNVTVSGVYIEDCNSEVKVSGLNATALRIRNVGFFEVVNFLTTNSANSEKCLITNAKGIISNSTFSGANSIYAGTQFDNSEVLLTNVDGSSNGIGINSISSLVKIGPGVTITGTTPRKTTFGGQIL